MRSLRRSGLSTADHLTACRLDFLAYTTSLPESRLDALPKLPRSHGAIARRTTGGVMFELAGASSSRSSKPWAGQTVDFDDFGFSVLVEVDVPRSPADQVFGVFAAAPSGDDDLDVYAPYFCLGEDIDAVATAVNRARSVMGLDLDDPVDIAVTSTGETGDGGAGEREDAGEGAI